MLRKVLRDFTLGMWGGGGLGFIGATLGLHAALIVVLIVVGCGAGVFGPPMVAARRSAPVAVVEAPPAEYEPTPEAVDACGHDDPAEPVIADHDGDGEENVIGWLCTHDGCLERVSHPAAIERNLPYRGVTPESTFRAGRLLVRRDPLHVARLRSLVDGHRGGMMILSRTMRHFEQGDAMPAEHYAAYLAHKVEGERLSAILREAEEDVRKRQATGVRCDGYREVPGRSPGSVTRDYAVPGECLCGTCPTGNEEVHEIRSHTGAVIRRIVVDRDAP